MARLFQRISQNHADEGFIFRNETGWHGVSSFRLGGAVHPRQNARKLRALDYVPGRVQAVVIRMLHTWVFRDKGNYTPRLH